AIGVTMLAGVALPWYGVMFDRWGAAFALRIPWMPYAVGTPGSWFAGPVVAVSFLVLGGFPWSALLPAALRPAARRWRDVSRIRRGSLRPESTLSQDDLALLAHEEREEHAAHFFLAALVAALVPVAFYPGPPMTAVLPALPAMALLSGRFVDHLLETPARLASVFGRALFMLGITGTAVAIAVSMAGTRVTALFPALRWVAPFALLSGWAPF